MKARVGGLLAIIVSTTSLISAPAWAKAALPGEVTATIDRLSRELDERGRSAIAADLDAYIAKHPVEGLSPTARLDIARLLLSLRGLAAAAPVARSALQSLDVPATVTPTALGPLADLDAGTLERIAIGLIAVGRRNDALAAIRGCWRRDRNDERGGFATSCRAAPVARVLAQMAWHDEAEALMNEMAARDDGRDPQRSMHLVIDRAQVAQSAGRYQHQLNVVDAALTKSPGAVTLLDARTAALRRLGRYEDAMAALTRRWRDRPRTPGVLARHFHAFLNFEGAATHRNGPYAAYAAAKKALLARAAADPSDAPAVFVAAMMALRDARFDDADRLFATLPALAPGDSRPLALRGFIALWRGDPKRARELADRAAKVDRHDASVPYLRSLVARHAGDAKRAAEHLQRFVTMRRERDTLRFRRNRRAVLSALYALRRGEIPDDTDRPDHPSRRYHRNSLHEPFELPPPSVLLGAAAAFLLAFGAGALWTWRRRSGR